MEYQLWKAVVAVVATLDDPPGPTSQTFRDDRIVAVYYWAVVHDRPVSWAVGRRNWPPHGRRDPLPSASTMSRRLGSPSVTRLLAAVERRVTAPTGDALVWVIDGQPLPIGGASGDRHAGYGRAARGKAKGYKLHVLRDRAGGIAAWRLAPMNTDERVMAARMLRRADIRGYILADANYDANPLHAICDALGNRQLLTRRRGGPGTGFGHRRQEPGRVRCIDRVESPFPAFAADLLHQRGEVERGFANLTNWGGGLGPLPAWVRTYPRVHRWVQAKLALNALKRTTPIST
jgi:hypothetical protein